MKEISKRIGCSLVAILLTFGVCLSCIGVTLCRYQVAYEDNLSFKVKGPGTYYIQSEQEEWLFDEQTQTLSLDFDVTNTISRTIPQTSHTFFVRWKTNLEFDVSMNVLSESGRDLIYKGQPIQQEDGSYEYRFMDENQNEIYFDLEGNQVSTQNIKLTITNATEAFVSEIIIIDRAYDLEQQKDYVTSQNYPLEVTSNYLSDTENLKIIMEDSIDITLTSNQTKTSKVTYQTSGEHILVTLTETDVNLEANQEVTVTLSYEQTEIKNAIETITVKWQILNASNEIEKELKADFIVLNKALLENVKPTVVSMDYVDEKTTFSKYQPLVLQVTSDTNTQLRLIENTIPKDTRYSLDQGESWYVLTKDGYINLSLEKDQPQQIIIDFYNSHIEWIEQKYPISLYYEYEPVLKTIEFDMEIEEVTPLAITNIQTGIINQQPIIYTTNIKDYVVSCEYLNQPIENIQDYFNIEQPSEMVTTMTLKEDITVPTGTYKLTLTQTYNNKIITQETFHFFVIEEEQPITENETNLEEQVQDEQEQQTEVSV